MAPDVHLEVLPPAQQALWEKLQQKASFFSSHDFYLAGGTALALQLGHRQSVDFDFFSQQQGIAEPTEKAVGRIGPFLLRDKDDHTLHIEIQGVYISFIGAYQYPALEPRIESNGLQLASVTDIALMKLLAITHRATIRDYIDLAAIFKTGVSLSSLLEKSPEKYGPQFNPMVALRTLVAFQDIDQEMPNMLDQELARSWQEIIQATVRKLG